MSKGRLHVHLGELKAQFKAKCAHGDLSNYTRYLIKAFVEDKCMILSGEVLGIIDKGDFTTAVELLLPGLQKLREERMQAGERKTKARKSSKASKGRRKGGVKSKKDKATENMYSKLMEGFK